MWYSERCFCLGVPVLLQKSRESEFPPTEEGLNASAKTFEFTRPICYDVSDVERMYQSRLQCPQSDAHVAADNFRGCRALLLLGRSVER